MEEQEGEDGEFTAKIDFGDVSQTTQNSESNTEVNQNFSDAGLKRRK